MHALSNTIVERYQVRKTRAQKAAFRAMLREALEAEGYAVTEEKSPGLGGTNIVVGDVARAKIIFTAHYDTCAELPVPNFLAPKNLVASLLYQVLLCALIFAVVFAISLLAQRVFGGMIARAIQFLTLLAVMALLFFGPANRHTANDNTSGVLVLTEALLSLPAAARGKVAFVFFDNEELGLLGSSFLKKTHGQHVRGKPLINFDCVSDGDHLLFVLGKGIRKDTARVARMERLLEVPDGKTKEFVPSTCALYPSDQAHFPWGVGVVALKRMPLVGYYVDRIHTRRDTRLDVRNLDVLRTFIIALAME